MAMVGKQAMVLVAGALLSLSLSGCASYRPAPKVFHEATIQPYRLDSGDRLRITVFEQPSLTNTYTVDQAGYIAFPLVGQVAARGATLTQLEGAIAQKLKQGLSPRSSSRAFSAIPTFPSRSIAIARSSSWARWVSPVSMPMFPA